MRHTSGAMALQLVDPANRHLEWHELIFGHIESFAWAGLKPRISPGCGKTMHNPAPVDGTMLPPGDVVRLLSARDIA